MQLSPLQSRLAASLCATFLIVVIYLLLFSPNFALAVEVHDGLPVILEDQLEGDAPISYQSEFAGVDRGIIGKTALDTVSLSANVPIRFSLEPGTSAQVVLPSSVIFAQDSDDVSLSDGSLELRRRDATARVVFLSANTCRHPEVEAPEAASPEAPQLQMSITTKPGGISTEGTDDPSVVSVGFKEGAVMHKVNATGDLYITITAPEVSAPLEGIYNLELAASTNEWYHSHGDEPSDLEWVSSDSRAILLRTRSLGLSESHDDWRTTRDAVKDDPPYVLFLEKSGSTSLNGVRRSYCGLQNYADISAVKYGKVSDTTVGITQSRQHFHIQGLAPGSGYSGILVHTGRRSLGKREIGQVGGGGRVFQSRQVETTPASNANCQVVSGLEFCDLVDYPVPANSAKFNTSEALGKFYDDYAKSMYVGFNNSLAQIACEAPDEAQFSLARTCNDCANAYKRWLCTVSIPRCEDIKSTNPFTQVRNLGQAFPNGTEMESSPAELADPTTQASRNAIIDSDVAPGPYREILPCDDVCYQLVQNCPAALGFTCPMPGMFGFEKSYGMRRDSQDLSCNSPGLEGFPSASSLISVPRAGLFFAVIAAVILI